MKKYRAELSVRPYIPNISTDFEDACLHDTIFGDDLDELDKSLKKLAKTKVRLSEQNSKMNYCYHISIAYYNTKDSTLLRTKDYDFMDGEIFDVEYDQL